MRTLHLTGNKLYKTAHSITIPNKLLTLIGENGCGKSSILEALFDQYKDNENENLRVICFASGQNESFTKSYDKYLNASRRYLIETYAEPEEKFISSFYFNVNWARVLIFMAVALKNEGIAKRFLKEGGYLNVEDAMNTLPILNIPFRIYIRYVRLIQAALKTEELEPDKKSIRKSSFHDIMTRLVEEKYKVDYDFTYSIYKQRINVYPNEVLDIFGNNVDAIFTFLGLSIKNENFIVLKDSLLVFSNGLELNDLSDGEFQLLTLYSLLDLFDDENTLFLFDEIDSHLYYENVNKLWETLKTTKGNVITTTHSGDSIIKNDFQNIKLVDKGLVNETTLADTILKRLNNLAAGSFYKMKIASKIEYIALVENKMDWFVFELLCRIKIPEFNEQKFNKIHYIPCSSGFDSVRQDFGKDKINWVQEFKKLNANEIQTKNIFMICDRDNLPIGDIRGNGVTANVPNATISIGNNGTAYLLSWKRKQIENYLLSYSMLSANNKLQEILSLLPSNVLVQNNGNDNDSVRNLEVKDNLKLLYIDVNPELGIDYRKLESIIYQIPSNEISDDILNMYNFIISKIN